MTFNNNLVGTYSSDSLRDLPRNYDQAREALSRLDERRGGARGKAAHNTYVCARESGAISIRLHQTDIVTFYPNDAIRLDSGGWQTYTTRDLMNRCGIRVGMAGGVPSVTWAGKEWTYVDGMLLGPHGVIYPVRTDSDPGNVRAKRRRKLARAKRAEAREDLDTLVTLDLFYWPGRSGGYSPHRGTVPEAFER